MIVSFADKDTEIIWNGRYSRKLPRDIQSNAYRKLVAINIATDINDLRVPPGNKLEKLSGDRAGQWSIRINSQWRICFTFIEVARDRPAQALSVEIVDYH